MKDKLSTLVGSVVCALCLLESPGSVAAASPSGASDAEKLRVGAFNIQVFGVSKLNRAGVLPVLVDIVRRYDIVLIQEIRDSSGEAIQTLLCAVNNCQQNSLSTYNMTISERLGRTNSKEQYAFIYQTSRVEVISTHQFDDPEDVFQREPYTVFIRSKLEGIPDFFLTGLHAQPDNRLTAMELNALVGVYNLTTSLLRTTNGVLLGDFNADCQYLSNRRYTQLSLVNDDRFTWLLEEDTTTSDSTTCAYDRIIIAGEITNLVANQSAQVFRFDTEYNLSPTETLDVSDHYPVEFQLQSTAAAGIASRPGDEATTVSGSALALKLSHFISVFLVVFIASVLL